MSQGARREAPWAQCRGTNGVEVEVFDETAPYVYANIFHVRLRVVARVPGACEPYERVLEKMGVFVQDLDRTQRELWAGFESQALPYLFAPEFPARFADHHRRSRPKVFRFARSA